MRALRPPLRELFVSENLSHSLRRERQPANTSRGEYVRLTIITRPLSNSQNFTIRNE